MAITNYERVGRALETLRKGLAPFVEREVMAAAKAQKITPETLRKFAEDPILAQKPIAEWDVAAVLRLMWEAWNEVFRDTLGFTDRSLVSELRAWRNKWAHQEAFASDDALRVMDSAERLLRSVGAADLAEEIGKSRKELMRRIFDEQVRGEKRKAGGSLIEAAAAGNLKPWREVIEPHDDVASGRYQQAEFAADLWQVYLGEASQEYQDPVEFFRRTYLTESLRYLLKNAVQRLSGTGGDPVVQLQTNFGGGKTHSMLALYHLFSGLPPAELPGVDEVLAEAGVKELPRVRRVVLVGNKISPGNPSKKPDGTVVRTLWGELAWQLGYAAGGVTEARRAYERVRADDENATNPGDRLRELFVEYGPCLILIDEWVAYARQLHDAADLPGGSFETQFSFAQALTESAKLAPHTLLVISLPASDSVAEDVEVGGLRGREALDRLRNVVGRLESPWRPASAEESFEIVRRRLFKPIQDPEAFKQRDVTARAFAELYQTQAAEFPPDTRERSYGERIRSAYPIHPEVFDRLYSDWSSLAKFQRTRGVLRLMAAVVHVLWEKGDKSPLILPSTLPLDDPRVHQELTRHLSDNWTPILEKDVDGPRSLPVELDSEVPNLGKYQAARRVARTIFLGSAPKVGTAQRGLEERRVKLGSVMPGEPPAVFGDALRRLAARATYLYQDGTHFWYDVQPTVTKLAEDRAEQLKQSRDRVTQELERRLREGLRNPGDFARIHVLPRASADVPDEPQARLVVIPPDYPHERREASPALDAARSILDSRGNAPRQYRNALVFLAADKTRLSDLEEAVRRYLAWTSILADRENLNLTPFQVRQAEEQRKAAEAAVEARIPEAYIWLLVPVQTSPRDGIKWQALRVTSNDNLVLRASKKLRSEEQLVLSLGPTVLRRYLDEIPLWDGDHVAVARLVDYFASYPYLPRLKGPEVLLRSIGQGVGLLSWRVEGFAYAEAFEEATGRYRGLVAGQSLSLVEPKGFVVRPEVAERQIEREGNEATVPTPVIAPPSPSPDAGRTLPEGATPPARKRPTRYFGRYETTPLELVKDAQRLADELVLHLAKLSGARVRVRIEIEAEVASGIPEEVARIVRENTRDLKVEGELE